RHHAHAHQRLDDIGAALGHALGQLLDRDGLGNCDLAVDLLLRHVVGVLATTVTLQTTLLLGARPCAEVVLALDGAADVDVVGAALGRLAARTRRLRQALVDARPHRRPAERTGTGRLGAWSTERATHRRAGGGGTGFDLLRLTRHRRLR